MAIATAVTVGMRIEIFDHHGQRSGVIPLHPGEVLQGYTDSTVSIASGAHAKVFGADAELMFKIYRGIVSPLGKTTHDDWNTGD